METRIIVLLLTLPLLGASNVLCLDEKPIQAIEYFEGFSGDRFTPPVKPGYYPNGIEFDYESLVDDK